MTKSRAELIFEEWKAALSTKDRSIDAVAGNFDELFESMKGAGASKEEVHEILPKAIKAHLPPLTVARRVYKTQKMNAQASASMLSESEYIAQWNQGIANKATNSFYGIYPNPVTPLAPVAPSYLPNSMSAEEYAAQRRYADKFPRLRTRELVEKMQTGAYDPTVDLEKFVEKIKDGNSK